MNYVNNASQSLESVWWGASKCATTLLSHLDSPTIKFLTEVRGAKITQNEKWSLFGGRWMNWKNKSIFKRRKLNGIM